MRQQNITRAQIRVDDSTSPWIHVETVGRIGMWAWDKKAIILDYSMKWIVGSNEEIPCQKNEIEDKILELFNGKTPSNSK